MNKSIANSETRPTRVASLFDRPSSQESRDEKRLPPPENKLNFPALDGFRAVAVLMVFVQHYVVGGKPALAWGWTGVDFFFVLSGFLITGILYDTRDAQRRFVNFYGRRTVRILPLYYGVFAAVLLLDPICHWTWPTGWYLWPSYLGNYARFFYIGQFVQGAGGLEQLQSTIAHPQFRLFFGHFWSLCIEEQFYLIWPVVVFLVKDRIRLRNICLATCVCCLAIRSICIFTVPSLYLNAQLLYRITPLRADALLLGGACALALRGKEAGFVDRLARPVFIFGAFGFILFESAYRILTHHFYSVDASGPVLSTIGFSLIDVFAVSVLLLSLDTKSHIYRVLTLKPLKNLGKISYGFYVFHDIPHIAYLLLVSRLLPGVSHPSRYITAVAFPGTLLLSYLSFRLFETPFLRLKRFFV